MRRARPSIAGFQPVEAEIDVSDERLVAQGFEIVAARPAAIVVPGVTEQHVPAGQIRTESWPMSAVSS